MENDNKKINVVRLFSDLSVFDSPKDPRTGTAVAFRSGDCVCFELVLLNYGDVADCGNMESVSFDILDIGEVESPLPRAPKILVQKTVSDINKNLTAEQIDGGACHCRIVLTSSDTTMKEGQKYLKITARDKDGDRTTFASGWINVEPVWDSDIDTSTSEGATVVEQLRGLIGKNSASISALHDGVAENASDISDINLTIAGYEKLLPSYESRIVAVEKKANKNSSDIVRLESRATTNENTVSALNTTVAGHTSDISELYGRVDGNATDIGAFYPRMGNVENTKADKATTLAGYGISDAYTKTQTDSLFSSAAENVDTKIAGVKTELEAAIDAGSTSSANSLLSLAKKSNRLFQTKLDTGVLYCNGGYARVPQAAFTSLSKATILIRFARDGATLTSEESLCNLGDGGTTATGLSVRITAAKGLYVLCSFKRPDGTNPANPHVLGFDITEYLDGKMHSLAVCWSGTRTRVFIDGALKGQSAALEEAGLAILASSQFQYGITVGVRYAAVATAPLYFRGQVSDFAVLNYDASEADSDGNYTSAYSIADYQNGRAIPPSMRPFSEVLGRVAAWSAMDNSPVDISVSGDVITLTTTAEISTSYFRIKPAGTLNGRAGQTLRASIDSISGFATTGDPIGLGVKPMKGATETGTFNLTNNTKSGSWYNTSAFDSFNLTIRYGSSPIPSGTVFTIAGFRAWVDGAVVALENCTFKSKIRDASGNGNTATVSGVLAGDRDESIAQMYEAFAAQYTADNP